MKQSKFSLADVLAILATLAFGFVCFLGANFLNIGNDEVWRMPRITGCIVIAIFCSLLLFATAYGAKLLKKTSHNFRTCFIWEVILLTLFVFFAFFFSTKTSPFTHFFTVTAKKSEINSKLQKSILQAENMFAEYETYANRRKNQYQSTLQRVVATKQTAHLDYTAYGFQNSSIPDNVQIETKMFTLHADLFPSNYSDTIANNGIKEVAITWLQNAKSITSSWKPIGIVGVVNNIKKNSKDWLNTLVKLSTVRAQQEQATDFEYTLLFDDVKTHFTKLENPTLLSIGFAVMVYLLIVLPWFVTKRDKRIHGAFTTKEYEVVL